MISAVSPGTFFITEAPNGFLTGADIEGGSHAAGEAQAQAQAQGAREGAFDAAFEDEFVLGHAFGADAQYQYHQQPPSDFGDGMVAPRRGRRGSGSSGFGFDSRTDVDGDALAFSARPRPVATQYQDTYRPPAALQGFSEPYHAHRIAGSLPPPCAVFGNPKVS